MVLNAKPRDFKTINIENYYRVNLNKFTYNLLRTYYIFMNNLR